MDTKIKSPPSYYRFNIRRLGKLKLRRIEKYQVNSNIVFLTDGTQIQVDSQWYCYLIQSNDKRRTYVGYTKNVQKRLRQHNGEIKGGAKATRSHRPWRLIVYVQGFLTANEAMSFEWYMHHPSSIYKSKLNLGDRRYQSGHGVASRLRNMETMLQHKTWLLKYTDPIYRQREVNIFWHTDHHLDVQEPQWYLDINKS